MNPSKQAKLTAFVSKPKNDISENNNEIQTETNTKRPVRQLHEENRRYHKD